MAESTSLMKADSMGPSWWEGLQNLPAFRQIGVMIGLAAGIALVTAVALWSLQPNYGVLYGNLSNKDVSQAMDFLQQQGIKYKLDDSTGALLVPADKVREVRLKLAAAGLPHSGAIGLDMLQQKQEFGTSQFIEVARYQRALEVELARSIATLNNVQSAQVHLALPKQSVFIRDQQHPSASVLVSLYPGRTIDGGQVAAITHLIAASIPNLDPSRVTVVDQMGHLLTGKNQSPQDAANQSQFDYTRKLENAYIARIENILSPIAGDNGVRAQVNADLDFTSTEQTQEIYNPDLPALRSEQVYDEKSVGAGAQGIPGALSNTPPLKATVPQTTASQTNAAGSAATGTTGAGGRANATAATSVQNGRSVTRETKNYELDRTISHSKLATGRIKRLSIAVVVDDKEVMSNGKMTSQPRTQAELARITALVKDAVGFDAQRGDTLNVSNEAFTQPQAVPPLPPVPVWKQPWVFSAAKIGAGVLAIALLLLGVLRPLLRYLAAVSPAPVAAGAESMAEDRITLGSAQQPGLMLPQHNTYENNLGMIRDMARQDPKHVAQVIKTWVTTDEK